VSAGDAGYVASPGAYSLAIDDIEFIGNTACGTGLTICGTGCVDTKDEQCELRRLRQRLFGHPKFARRTVAFARPLHGLQWRMREHPDRRSELRRLRQALHWHLLAGSCQAQYLHLPACRKLDYTRTTYASITQNNVTGSITTCGHFWSDWLARHLGYMLHPALSAIRLVGARGLNWSGTSNQVKSYASAVLGWHWGWKITRHGAPVQISANKNVDLWLELPSHPGSDHRRVLRSFSLRFGPTQGYADQPTEEDHDLAVHGWRGRTHRRRGLHDFHWRRPPAESATRGAPALGTCTPTCRTNQHHVGHAEHDGLPQGLA